MSRSRYWSNSDLADWIRGSDKPEALEWFEWEEWEEGQKLRHPFRHWIAEEALDFIQDVIHWVPDRINDVRYWFNNRFVYQTHVLSTGLAKGEWHEFDTRMLHGLFNGLVDFVEVEKALRNIRWDTDYKNKYAPWYVRHWFFRWVEWRSPQSGINHLEWEVSLGEESPHQSAKAKEVLELYYWWKKRPERDAMKESGLVALLSEYDKKYGKWHSWMVRTPVLSEAEKAEYERRSDLSNDLEQKWEDEDTEMLIRLVRLRSSVWT